MSTFREKNIKDAEISASREKCNDLMMLKFGQIIDIDALENFNLKIDDNEADEKIK